MLDLLARHTTLYVNIPPGNPLASFRRYDRWQYKEDFRGSTRFIRPRNIASFTQYKKHRRPVYRGSLLQYTKEFSVRSDIWLQNYGGGYSGCTLWCERFQDSSIGRGEGMLSNTIIFFIGWSYRVLNYAKKLNKVVQLLDGIHRYNTLRSLRRVRLNSATWTPLRCLPFMAFLKCLLIGNDSPWGRLKKDPRPSLGSYTDRSSFPGTKYI